MKRPVVLMLSLLVLPWLCLASAAFDYPQVKFSTVWVTPDKYNSFIDSVRAALVSTAGGKSNGIPVLRTQDDPVAQQTFLNITLTNKAGHHVSLKMNVTGAHFTAYVAGIGKSATATCWKKPFSSSVAALLESSSCPAPGVVDDNHGLGSAATWRVQDLDEAISSLFLFAFGKATKEDMRCAVATCDMMIASAAKFPYIQRRMSAGMWDGVGNGVSDDPSLHGLQERWPALSAAVQVSHQGAFAAPVAVRRSDGSSLQVDNVRRAVPLMSFLEHKCDKALMMPMAIRSVVQDAAEMGGALATTCAQAEPTMHIVGAEGKCVDVPYSSYVSGTQVILWPCRSNDYDDMNQLWTFKRDGTIRCQGMCLVAAATAAGAAAVIDHCWRVPAYRAVWEVRTDGTIALRSSGLALAVTSPVNRAGVTVGRDDRGTGQSWTPTNDTAPLVAPILGYRDLYLQVQGTAVFAAPCGGAGAGVEWALYPDGSIRRPTTGGSGCLAPDGAGRVVVSPCDLAGSSRQRWVFRNDGTILNAGTGKVMDVRPRLVDSGGCVDQRVVSEWEVLVSAATGSPTQNWSIML